jgi:hypothetical protein
MEEWFHDLIVGASLGKIAGVLFISPYWNNGIIEYSMKYKKGRFHDV